MTALLRRVRLAILGKELLREITEEAWNDGHTLGQLKEREIHWRERNGTSRIYSTERKNN